MLTGPGRRTERRHAEWSAVGTELGGGRNWVGEAERAGSSTGGLLLGFSPSLPHENADPGA